MIRAGFTAGKENEKRGYRGLKLPGNEPD